MGMKLTRLVAAGVLLAAPAAHADAIRGTFTGTVSTVHVAQGLAVSVGDSIAGAFCYETDPLPECQLPGESCLSSVSDVQFLADCFGSGECNGVADTISSSVQLSGRSFVGDPPAAATVQAIMVEDFAGSLNRYAVQDSSAAIAMAQTGGMAFPVITQNYSLELQAASFERDIVPEGVFAPRINFQGSQGLNGFSIFSFDSQTVEEALMGQMQPLALLLEFEVDGLRIAPIGSLALTTGVMTIPAVDLPNGTRYSVQLRIVLGSSPLQFDILGIQQIAGVQPGEGNATFDPGTGVLSIPAVRLSNGLHVTDIRMRLVGVGGGVRLQLTSASVGQGLCS